MKYIKETNIKQAIHAEPVNEDDPEKKVCTIEAKERMFEHGFILHEARTLNDHYKQFCLNYRLIREYLRNFSEQQMGVMTPDITNYFFLVKNKDVHFNPLYTIIIEGGN